jgi:hypothetical protein
MKGSGIVNVLVIFCGQLMLKGLISDKASTGNFCASSSHPTTIIYDEHDG